MICVTAVLSYLTPADREPSARLTGVYDSAAEARAASRGNVVLSVTWSQTSRRPRVGEILPTTASGAVLEVVVLPLGHTSTAAPWKSSAPSHDSYGRRLSG